MRRSPQPLGSVLECVVIASQVHTVIEQQCSHSPGASQGPSPLPPAPTSQPQVKRKGHAGGMRRVEGIYLSPPKTSPPHPPRQVKRNGHTALAQLMAEDNKAGGGDGEGSGDAACNIIFFPVPPHQVKRNGHTALAQRMAEENKAGGGDEEGGAAGGWGRRDMERAEWCARLSSLPVGSSPSPCPLPPALWPYPFLHVAGAVRGGVQGAACIEADAGAGIGKKPRAVPHLRQQRGGSIPSSKLTISLTTATSLAFLAQLCKPACRHAKLSPFPPPPFSSQQHAACAHQLAPAPHSPLPFLSNPPLIPPSSPHPSLPAPSPFPCPSLPSNAQLVLISQRLPCTLTCYSLYSPLTPLSPLLNPLVLISQRLPRTLDALQEIPGIGRVKVNKYGARVLETIERLIEEHNKGDTGDTSNDRSSKPPELSPDQPTDTRNAPVSSTAAFPPPANANYAPKASGNPHFLSSDSATLKRSLWSEASGNPVPPGAHGEGERAASVGAADGGYVGGHVKVGLLGRSAKRARASDESGGDCIEVVDVEDVGGVGEEWRSGREVFGDGDGASGEGRAKGGFGNGVAVNGATIEIGDKAGSESLFSEYVFRKRWS
ncbi:unnamed protein product [Closterium sp. NIES-54]